MSGGQYDIKGLRGVDKYEDRQRVQKYKDLANQAIEKLIPIEKEYSNNPSAKFRGIKLHEVYYRLAQSYYNLWEYDQALKNINRAIMLADKSLEFSSQVEYEDFRDNHIVKTKEHYEK